MKTRGKWIVVVAVIVVGCGGAADESPPPGDVVPDWVSDAVFYQIFPERFADGDSTNQPVHRWHERPDEVPESWTPSDWTADWYRQQPWEVEMGGGFYGPIYSRRYGGDLQGVIDRLPYLDSLGVNALYFNPVFQARSLHKYDGSTYHHVDPYFGPDPEGDLELIASETADPATWQWTAADSLFLDLLRRAHGRDMRIVLDGVFNHTGRDFFAFADLHEHQAESRYADWYVVHAFDDPATDSNEFDYEGWWGVKSLPEFADNEAGDDLHPGPAAYILDATARWMDPNGDGDPSDGIDGWRLDVAPEVPVGFWERWNEHVRSINPEAYTVAEDWEEASTFLQDGGFSATMNYHGFAYPVKGFLIDGRMTGEEFSDWLAEARASYGRDRTYAMLNLVDGHDTDRMASMIVNRDSWDAYLEPDRFDYDWGPRVSPMNGAEAYSVAAPDGTDRRLQRLVILFQMSYVGAPMIYYGTEAGMWGADDPDDRQPMVWPEMEFEPQSRDPLGRERPVDPVGFDHDLFQYVRQLVALRRSRPALVDGDWTTLLAPADTRVIVALRSAGDDRLVLALNREPDERALAIEASDLELEPGERLQTLFASAADAHLPVERRDEAVIIRLPGLSGVLFEVTNQP